MLEALERGVRGGKWHSLYDKVYAERTLEGRVATGGAKRRSEGSMMCRSGLQARCEKRLAN